MLWLDIYPVVCHLFTLASPSFELGLDLLRYVRYVLIKIALCTRDERTRKLFEYMFANKNMKIIWYCEREKNENKKHWSQEHCS